MIDLSHIFDGAIGDPDKERPRTYRPVKPTKPKSAPVHTLSREEYLRRKAELEAQYALPFGKRWENLNPDCYIPLTLTV